MVTEAEARRQRPMMSGIVALAVALAAAIGWYYAGRPDEATRPVKTVEWKTWVNASRTDGKLVTYAPVELPEGWRATSANYRPGADAHWHLGLLTAAGKFVGIEESREGTSDLIEQYVDPEAEQGDDIKVEGITWKVFTDSGGDYALIRTVEAPNGEQERVLVFGSAPDSQVRMFASLLVD